MRFELLARGVKGHTGVRSAAGDLSERLIAARAMLEEIFGRHLTRQAGDGWVSQARFPFLNVGTPGIYNISAAQGVLGVEIRPIPQDDVGAMQAEIEAFCGKNTLELRMLAMENGIACSPDNPALLALLGAVKQASGAEARIGKKLAGTSARFAPDGQGVVWGQSGIGPHARDERHYIPSILPYYDTLNALSVALTAKP